MGRKGKSKKKTADARTPISSTSHKAEAAATLRCDRLSADAPEWHPQSYMPTAVAIDETAKSPPSEKTDDRPIPSSLDVAETDQADATGCTTQPTPEELPPPSLASPSVSDVTVPPVSCDANGYRPAEKDQVDHSCVGDISNSVTCDGDASAIPPPLPPATDAAPKNGAILLGESSTPPAIDDDTAGGGSTVCESVATDSAQNIFATDNKQEDVGATHDAICVVEEVEPEPVSDGDAVGTTVTEESEPDSSTPACTGSADVGEVFFAGDAPISVAEEPPLAPDVAAPPTKERSSPPPAVDDYISSVLGATVDSAQEVAAVGNEREDCGAHCATDDAIGEPEPEAIGNGGAVATTETGGSQADSVSPACTGSADVGALLPAVDAPLFETENAPPAPDIATTVIKDPSSPLDPSSALPVVDNTVGDGSEVLGSASVHLARDVVATGHDNERDNEAICEAACVAKESLPDVAATEGDAAATRGGACQPDDKSPVCTGAPIVECPGVADAPAVAPENAPPTPSVAETATTCREPLEPADTLSAPAAVESDQAAGVDSAEKNDKAATEVFPEAGAGGGPGEEDPLVEAEVLFKKSDDGARVTGTTVVATPVVGGAVDWTDSVTSIGHDEATGKASPSTIEVSGRGQKRKTCEYELEDLADEATSLTEDATSPTENGSEPDLSKGKDGFFVEGGGVKKSAAKSRWRWGVVAVAAVVLVVGLSRRRRA